MLPLLRSSATVRQQMASDARALALVTDSRREAGSGETDPAYPEVSLVDALYPAQTRAALPPPLDGVATPAMWARLAEPLRRTLAGFWRELGLREAGQPSLWVTIHFGRIALNAHGLERLRALLAEREPDPALVVPATGLARAAEAWERWRAWRRVAALRERVRRAGAWASAELERLGRREASELDAAVLARGPLDDARWADVLAPPLLAALEAEPQADPCLDAALAFEQRWATVLGQRLVAAGTLPAPSAIAYLTVEERLRAVHGADAAWSDLAGLRAERVKRFAALDLPLEFWGRPRGRDHAQGRG
jgi:hypothetical protein